MRVVHLAASSVSLARFVVPLLPRMESLGQVPILAPGKREGQGVAAHGRPVVPLGIDRGWRIPRGLVDATANTNALLQVQPDVVVVHTPAAALSARRSLEQLKGSGVHMVYVARGSLHESDSYVARTAWNALNPISWELWDGVITVSRNLEKAAHRSASTNRIARVSLSAAFPNVPTGVLTSGKDSFKPGARLRLGWVGRLDRDKRPGDMVQLVEALEEEFGLEVEVSLMGNATPGDRKPHIPSHPRIAMMGWVEHPCLTLGNCDLHIMTSLREGYALSPLEAAIVGTPTIAYANTGNRESVPEVGGQLVAPRDIHGLAVQIHQYSTSDLQHKIEKRIKVRELARNLMRDSDPAAEIVHFLKSVVNDTEGRGLKR